MDDLLINLAQILFANNYLPVKMTGTLTLGILGYKIYSGISQVSNSWDKFFKDLGKGMMALAVIGILLFVFKII